MSDSMANTTLTDSTLTAKATSRVGRADWIAAVVLAVALGIVYGQAARAPFVHDDNISVLHNPSIVRPWPPFGTVAQPGALRPPRDAVTSGRPLLNLTLALNYAVGGYNPVGYHLVNLLIHIAASILLYGIVRRTLLLDRFRERFGFAASQLGLAVALVWAFHPLQTDAVEYVSQRTESLMGLFYLATLYASVRYFTVEAGRARTLAAAGATAACWAGVACKEVMVSAPLMVLLYDWAFVSGSLRRAVKHAWPLYAGLASGWVFLLVLNLDAPRSQAAGLQAGLPAYVWWFTQAKVALIYLKLSLWPWPLIIHHETPILWTLASAWPWLATVLIAAIATFILLCRRHPLGYLGAWFFIILSPTFAVPMPSEVVAERRMYLPLAAVVVVIIVGGFAALTHRKPAADSGAAPAGSRAFVRRSVLIVSSGLALILAVVTSVRLEAYRDVISIWQDAVAHQPDNVRATINLGCALDDAGRSQEAVAQFERALEIDPTRPDVGLAHRSLGLTWAKLGQPEKAIHHLDLAMRLRPDVADDHGALGSLLLSVRRFPAAAEQLELAVRQQPSDVLAHANLATAYANLGRQSQALAQADEARLLAQAQGAGVWVEQIDAWLHAYRGGLTQR
jgi:tetratricopeptide (TPR) repeat protein